jgi:predicted PurR-regulated permease PerM
MRRICLAELVIPCPTWKEVKPWLYKIAGLALILYLAFLVREIWLPLAIAFLIALVLDPVVDRMERKGFSRGVAAATIFAAFLLILVGLLVLSIPPIVEQIGTLQQRITKVVPDQSPAGIDAALKQQGASPALRSIVKTIIGGTSGSVSRTSELFTGRVMEYAANMIWMVIVPIVAFYALRDFHLILAKGLLLVRKDKRDIFQVAVTEVTTIFAKYMRGLVIVSALNGLATWLLLLALGVPSALVLGLAAGVLYSVPYIGAIITVVLISLVSFLAGGMDFMLLVLGANILLHQIIFDQIVTPRIVGGHVGLHPILAIIALLAGNTLLGILGMILAVPVAACIQIGVLALLPKLRQEIDLTAPEDTTASIAEETKEDQLRTDATTELHESVNHAVDTIDSKVAGDKIRAARVQNRRKSRAADNVP